ncbi:DUF1629 domain-containing protein [Myxococcus sp. SDU36]|uniref:imm11 family protein n=1 Tax=Myxococcus sp. SDU36 TaxID=2831967 RepID=UPI002543591B|nr:DUF1629 domain-containing protein [Myxococcus sp. SDU36]
MYGLPSPVVSPRLKEVLEAAELPGVQFVPADVQTGDGVLRYWLMHMWRAILCMDRQRSIFEETEVGHVLLSLDKLVLDEAVLREVPLHERRAFMLEEDTVHLFHRSVVEQVLSLSPSPKGLRFVPVSEWSDASGFR